MANETFTEAKERIAAAIYEKEFGTRAAVLADREKRAQSAEPVAWRWKHIKDDRWYYGKLPKHLQPRPGVKLPNHLIEPLYAAPQPTPEDCLARLRVAVGALKELRGAVHWADCPRECDAVDEALIAIGPLEGEKP